VWAWWCGGAAVRPPRPPRPAPAPRRVRPGACWRSPALLGWAGRGGLASAVSRLPLRRVRPGASCGSRLLVGLACGRGPAPRSFVSRAAPRAGGSPRCFRRAAPLLGWWCGGPAPAPRPKPGPPTPEAGPRPTPPPQPPGCARCFRRARAPRGLRVPRGSARTARAPPAPRPEPGPRPDAPRRNTPWCLWPSPARCGLVSGFWWFTV